LSSYGDGFIGRRADEQTLAEPLFGPIDNIDNIDFKDKDAVTASDTWQRILKVNDPTTAAWI
jgi:hypothetical protein